LEIIGYHTLGSVFFRIDKHSSFDHLIFFSSLTGVRYYGAALKRSHSMLGKYSKYSKCGSRMPRNR